MTSLQVKWHLQYKIKMLPLKPSLIVVIIFITAISSTALPNIVLILVDDVDISLTGSKVTSRADQAKHLHLSRVDIIPAGIEQDKGIAVWGGCDIHQCICDNSGLLPQPLQHPHRAVPAQLACDKQLCVGWLRLSRVAGWPRATYLCHLLEITGRVIIWSLQHLRMKRW